MAEPPRRGIREDPGREQLCTLCILSPEISDIVCVRGRLPPIIHFFFCVLTSQQLCHPNSFCTLVSLSFFIFYPFSTLSIPSSAYITHSPLLSTPRAFLSCVTLTFFPAFPHLLRILSYRDAVSCVSLIASRFFIRAKLGGKQALITVARLKHAQHAHQFMNPSHSNPCPTHCATQFCDWRSWGSVLQSNFNCVTTKPSF